jgi:hypothetical protein
MDVTKTIWLAGLFIASISTNTTLIKLVTDDKLERPNIVSLFFNSLLTIVGGFFSFLLLGLFYASGFILFNIASFFFILYITKRRTVTALEYAEKLLINFKAIDLQISYILNEMYSGRSKDLARPTRRTLRFILSELPNVLGLDSSHHPQFSILVPQDKKFMVVAYEGIESFRIARMEELFQYGKDTVSLAGHAMNQKSPVIVNDLANETDPNLLYWTRTSPNEAKEGSILAYPIIRGLGSPDADPIAILCITSAKKNAFVNKDAINRVLAYFSLKIEILQNCIDLTTFIEKKKAYNATVNNKDKK